jgi:hypothetical protein
MMLTTLLTVLNIRCPSVFLLTVPFTVLYIRYLMLNTVRVAVNINYWWIPYA